MSISGSEQITLLAATLQAAPASITAELRPLVEHTATAIRDGARDRISAIRHSPTHLPAYPASITATVQEHAGGMSAEIGPDKSLPQGPLGSILEYGTSRHAPYPHLGPAFEEQVPLLVDEVAAIVARAFL